MGRAEQTGWALPTLTVGEKEDIRSRPENTAVHGPETFCYSIKRLIMVCLGCPEKAVVEMVNQSEIRVRLDFLKSENQI